LEFEVDQSPEQKRLVLELFELLKHAGIAHVRLEIKRCPALFAAISLLL